MSPRMQTNAPAASNVEHDPSFEERLAAIRSRVTAHDFLENKGLGNEVGIHVFAYPPERVWDVRAQVAELEELSRAGKLSCCIHVRDLWDVLLQVCDQKRIADKIDALELKRGSDALRSRLQKIATPEAMVAAMDWQPHERGRDVLFVTGVGRVYPFVRAHQILENGQHVFDDIPVVLFYPGTYNGRELTLFGDRTESANYYRAFNLI